MSLWQKNETERNTSDSSTESTASSRPAAPSREPRGERNTNVNIGPSIEIKGELTGNEDLTIDGKVDGKIVLRDHNLTIGKNGRINADIRAKGVTVNGEVTGNITADDRVEIAPTGSVKGDLCAPRVALADGSSFKGSIDMGGSSNASTSSSPGGGSSQVREEIPVAAKA
jgi:cytoskeletal protein CcmA (bactofilin family)